VKRIIATALLCLPPAALACGEVVTLKTHGSSTTRYALSVPKNATAALVLLPGGGGYADLGADGCAQKLKGNSLIRSQALFHKEGLATALVDAPSDYTGADGLGGFRAQPAHAEDLGKVIADLRARLKLPVWLVGTSRGTISAANAAGRLAGAAAPDGIVLTSSVTVGTSGGRLPWTAQTVFDARLHAIRQPALLVAHASDGCFRSPPSGLEGIADRLKSERLQKIVVTGGSPGKGNACEGRSPHGFNGLEAEVAAGIARFVRGGRY
jgi:hypothetical protein